MMVCDRLKTVMWLLIHTNKFMLIMKDLGATRKTPSKNE
jgi:hypothetical protein